MADKTVFFHLFTDFFPGFDFDAFVADGQAKSVEDADVLIGWGHFRDHVSRPKGGTYFPHAGACRRQKRGGLHVPMQSLKRNPDCPPWML